MSEVRRARIGVVGGGQLAQMLHQSAISLGISMVCLGTDPADPVALAGGELRIGAHRPTATELRSLATEADVITFEHELVDPAMLAELEAAGIRMAPSASTLAMVIDKAEMRRVTTAAGIVGPRWEVADDLAALEPAVDRRISAGVGVVLKATTGGYDGRGVVLLPAERSAADQRRRALAEGERLLGVAPAVLVEDLVPLDAELAVVVVRGADGQMSTYEPVLTVQADGQCREVRLPSGLEASVVHAAREIACRAAEAVGVVGLLAVELLVSDGRLLLNELAARPHNSGHLTIEAATTSQFENHLRAVAGLAIGSTATTVAEATMVNLIGDETATDPRDRLGDGLAADQGAHVHLYAKSVRPERKVGHVTVCAHEPGRDGGAGATRARAWSVARALGASLRGSTR